MQDDRQPGKEHVTLTCDTEKEGAFEEAKRRQLAAVDGCKSKNPTTALHIDKSSYTFTCRVKCFATIAQNSVPKSCHGLGYFTSIAGCFSWTSAFE